MPRIAIPVPHSEDPEYAERAFPQYAQAVEMADGVPVRIPLDSSREEVMQLILGCQAVLLPGSKADVDPAKYDAQRSAKTAPADARRDLVDELLLQDAYKFRKPILGICYGLQILNVYRGGTLCSTSSLRLIMKLGGVFRSRIWRRLKPGRASAILSFRALPFRALKIREHRRAHLPSR